MLVEKTGYINNQQINYNNTSKFLIQYGKGKDRYYTKFTIIGDLDAAITCYETMPMLEGYKKRLYLSDSEKPIIMREIHIKKCPACKESILT